MLLAEKKVGHPLLDLPRKTAVVIGGTSGIGLDLWPAGWQRLAQM